MVCPAVSVLNSDLSVFSFSLTSSSKPKCQSSNILPPSSSTTCVIISTPQQGVKNSAYSLVFVAIIYLVFTKENLNKTIENNRLYLNKNI